MSRMAPGDLAARYAPPAAAAPSHPVPVDEIADAEYRYLRGMAEHNRAVRMSLFEPAAAP